MHGNNQNQQKNYGYCDGNAIGYNGIGVGGKGVGDESGSVGDDNSIFLLFPSSSDKSQPTIKSEQDCCSKNKRNAATTITSKQPHRKFLKNSDLTNNANINVNHTICLHLGYVSLPTGLNNDHHHGNLSLISSSSSRTTTNSAQSSNDTKEKDRFGDDDLSNHPNHHHYYDYDHQKSSLSSTLTIPNISNDDNKSFPIRSPCLTLTSSSTSSTSATITTTSTSSVPISHVLPRPSILKSSNSKPSSTSANHHQKTCPKGGGGNSQQRPLSIISQSQQHQQQPKTTKYTKELTKCNLSDSNKISRKTRTKTANNFWNSLDDNVVVTVVDDYENGSSTCEGVGGDSADVNNGKNNLNCTCCDCYQEELSLNLPGKNPPSSKTTTTTTTTKSVQILTPTKSEHILFDPKLSAANSFFTIPPSSTIEMDESNSIEKIENDIDHHQHNNFDIHQNNYHLFNNNSNDNNDEMDDIIINERSTMMEYESNRDNDTNQSPSSSLSSSYLSSNPYPYCDCSPEQIQPITYQMCSNCHKPLSMVINNNNDIDNSDRNYSFPSNSTSPLIERCSSLSDSNNNNNNDDDYVNNNNDNSSNHHYQQYHQPHLNYGHYSYSNGYSQNLSWDPNVVIYTPIIASTNDNYHPQYDEDCDSDFDAYEIEDRAHYCSKCNIWFGSFDPSYPSTCNCVQKKSNTLTTNDSGSVYSVHMRKDFRYYFQHPYCRLFVAYFVIFCNFLIFAEDPLSHSLMECSIPVLGNVISLLFTKYPPEPEWYIVQIIINVSAVFVGLFLGKYFLHNFLLRKIFRLKMFRDESGTWMIMLISMFISCYFASIMYNRLLFMFHPNAQKYLITSKMGMTYSSFMKLAACGTWCGDFFTAWMITDMMLQDNLYPNWAPWLRSFWHQHANIRIVVFWTGSLVIAASVIRIILTEAICWDCINHGFFSTSESSRAFLASCILVMDLLIVMQDWDFPHFVCDLNIKLPGLLRPSYTLNFFQKSVQFPEVEIRITGKWFNYGIIVFVMMLDLNMWKNQVIYNPPDFGQYVDKNTCRVYSITDQESIDNAHMINWTYEIRSKQINPVTNRTYITNDLMIYSRYIQSAWVNKGLSLIPILGGFTFFGFLVFFYGRFPPKTDASLGGRLPKRRAYSNRSSWYHERCDSRRNKNGRLSQNLSRIIKIYNINKVNFNDKNSFEPKKEKKLNDKSNRSIPSSMMRIIFTKKENQNQIIPNDQSIKNDIIETSSEIKQPIENPEEKIEEIKSSENKLNKNNQDKDQKNFKINPLKKSILTPISSRLGPIIPNLFNSLIGLGNLDILKASPTQPYIPSSTPMHPRQSSTLPLASSSMKFAQQQKNSSLDSFQTLTTATTKLMIEGLNYQNQPPVIACQSS